MPDNWADKFKKKLQEKEQASQENTKSAKTYQDATTKLFDHIEKKIKEIGMIAVTKNGLPMKSLHLKCQDKLLSFIPEGVNVDSSRGRIRVKHNCKNLSQFIYLNMMIDPKSAAAYPDNLMWVINWNGTLEDVKLDTLPEFKNDQLERLIEVCFVE